MLAQATDVQILFQLWIKLHTNSVYIAPDAHYEQEVTIPAQTAIFPSVNVTEESVEAVLEQLKQT